MRHVLVRGLVPSFVTVLALAACTGSAPDSVAATPPVAAPATPPAPSGPVFFAAPGWDGPTVQAARAAADAPLVVRIAAPTAGFTFTLDAVAVKDGAREVQVTLLEPASTVVVAQVVTELELQVAADKLVGKEPLAVALRRMQDGAHYFAPPPWLRAVVQQQ